MLQHYAAAALTALGLALPAAARTDSVGMLYPQIAVVSDYRYDGFSSSNRSPTLQFSLYLWRPDDWYAGVWISGVDYRDAGGTSYEVDLYAGRHVTFGNTRGSLELMATLFPDQEGPGPSYGFVQGIARLRHTTKWAEFNAALAWTPSGSSGSGETWRASASVTVAVSDRLSFSAGYGARTSERGQDRQYWDVGATYTWRSLAFDVRYYDTNLDRAQCYGTDWCAPGLAAKITYTLPMIAL